MVYLKTKQKAEKNPQIIRDTIMTKKNKRIIKQVIEIMLDR